MGAWAAHHTGSAQGNLAIESSPSPCCPTPPAGRPPRLSATAARDTIKRRILWLGPMPRRKFAWVIPARRGVAGLRLKDLKVTVEGTWLEDCLARLHEELARAGHPGAAACLDLERVVQPGKHARASLSRSIWPIRRLMQLEKKMIIDVEGGTWSECMSILRHEAGHVVQHSYQLHRRRRWQQLFGPSSQRYPRYYRPNPASRNFVQHLRLWYAQSHPDEDFAETFAVWLRPRSNWRARYAGWPALKKLEYVDELMAEIAAQRPTAHRSRARSIRSASSPRRSASTIGKSRRSTPSIRPQPTTAICCGCSPPIRGTTGSEPASIFIRRNRAKDARTGGEVDRRISAHPRRRA